MELEGTINWTIFVALISSTTSYLFMKYGTVEKILLHLTDFTREDIKKVKGLLKWKY
ncbi:MAG TPA: hypothetical protein K8V88_04870 [Companilactobacillus farciminis]|uniref:Uncharacterized protein n=1 Tax=Companilactobacillus farciminis TaxID=1612 RepID=A0A921HRY2_9LACO|nr:hypothetical protein [Companilactobacillus farciminis]